MPALPRGAGPCQFNGRTLYAVFVVLPDGSVRVRVNSFEWERAGIPDGQRLTVALPDEPGPGATYFVFRSTWVDGWYWVELVRVSAGSRASAYPGAASVRGQTPARVQ